MVWAVSSGALAWAVGLTTSRADAPCLAARCALVENPAYRDHCPAAVFHLLCPAASCGS